MDFNYPIKHWVSTLLISPILLAIYDRFTESSFMFDMLSTYVLFLFMGALFSSPALFIYYWVHRYLETTQLKGLYIKLILVTLASTLIFVVFKIIAGAAQTQFTVAYVLGVSISAWFFPIRDIDQ